MYIILSTNYVLIAVNKNFAFVCFSGMLFNIHGNELPENKNVQGID